MGDISFTQTFHHTDFGDNRERVRADDPNGFNPRFNKIEADLNKLSTVVAQIDTKLNQAAVSPPRLLTLPLSLVTPAGAQPWVISTGGEVAPAAGAGATGVLDAAIPNGATLLSFHAAGRASGVSIALTLARVPIGGTTAQTLATVTGDASPFDKSAPVDASVAKVATSTFRYIVQATVPALATGNVAAISTFQILLTID